MKRIILFVVCVSVMMGLRPADSSAQSKPTVEERVNGYLAEGQISQGAAALATELKKRPADEALRFGCGFMQFAEAVQRLGQSWYRYGVRLNPEVAGMIPVLRLPVPINPEPEPVKHEQVCKVLARFVDDLMVADRTLAPIKGDATRLGIRLGQGYLDFDGDGKTSEPESLWRIYASVNRQARVTPEQAANFLIRLDAGDACWLRGYCHLMSGLLEFYLAYDDAELFDHTAHLFFAQPETPYPFLRHNREEGRPIDYQLISDFIAMIHLIDFPVKDAGRSAAALEHFKQVIQLSRQSWVLYEKETDDDHEWIPNPKQTGVIPGVRVNEEMVENWRMFLDEAEGILEGRVLIPFWRGTGDQAMGVNLKRVFMEPRRFDLVLWVQGTEAAPYLEEGVLTQPDFWGRLWEAFNGNFVGYALWFN